MSETIYNVVGKVYKYSVVYPGTGLTYYVVKRSKNGSKVGKMQGFKSQAAAIQDADRRARSEGFT